jgi:hypothetical protein
MGSETDFTQVIMHPESSSGRDEEAAACAVFLK